MKKLLIALLSVVLLLISVSAFASTESLVNPKVFREPGWARNAEKTWMYKRQYAFTPYEEPQYGFCTANKVTVRKVPDITFRKLGYLIEGAPFIILGACECEDTLLCDTAHGQGWIPRRYVEPLSGEDEYNDYKVNNPSNWNKEKEHDGGGKKGRPGIDYPWPDGSWG